MNLKEACIKLDAAKMKVAEVNTELALAKADKEEAEQAVLTAMVDEGVPSIRLDEYGLFSMKTENYMSVTKANEFDFIEYLKAIGQGGLLKETVAANTLKMFLTSHLEELKSKIIKKSEDLPDDIRVKLAHLFKAEDEIDEIQARDIAIEFMKSKGVSTFSDKSISQTGKKKS